MSTAWSRDVDEILGTRRIASAAFLSLFDFLSSPCRIREDRYHPASDLDILA